jgi:Tol biopolymer transport system component
MAPDGADLRKVAETPGDNFAPRFSPGGQALVYYNVPPGQASKPEPGSTTLHPASRIMFAADGTLGEASPLGTGTIQAWEGQADPALSPGNALLAFRGKPAGQQHGLFLANLASDAPQIPITRLTTGVWDRQPTWSPDGKLLAFTSGGSAEESQIWVINVDGTGRRRLTDQVSKQRDHDPVWRPDGTGIVFASNRATGKLDLFAVDLGGTLRGALTSGELTNQRSPSFSPDGAWLAFSSDREGNLDILVAPSDVSRWTNVTRAPSRDAQPSWGR